MPKLVLLRHGESQWNKENRFTGWVDVDLSPKGLEEAARAGELIRETKLLFAEAHTSLLRRAIRTLWITLDKVDQMYLTVHRNWRLNERHYGALQGLNKVETAQKYGDEQVFIWRRSYDIPPPAMDDARFAAQSQDHHWRFVEKSDLPRTEALLHCKNRVMPYWEQKIVPTLKRGENVLIVAHGNSLRALVKELDQVPDDEIAELNIPTGFPLVYELDAQLRPLSRQYLGDPKAAEEAAKAVAKQTHR